MNDDRPHQLKQNAHVCAPLQIQSYRISKKRNLKVCFVKNGKVSNMNTLSYDNIHTAKRVLVNPLNALF